MAQKRRRQRMGTAACFSAAPAHVSLPSPSGNIASRASRSSGRVSAATGYNSCPPRRLVEGCTISGDGGGGDFGLTPPAFVEQISMPAGSWRRIPGPPSGILTPSFPSLGWSRRGCSVPGDAGWHAGRAPEGRPDSAPFQAGSFVRGTTSPANTFVFILHAFIFI